MDLITRTDDAEQLKYLPAHPVSLANKIGHWLTIAILLATLGTIFLVGYWEFWPVEVMRLNKPIVVTGDVKLPGWLYYQMDYCKNDRFSDNYALVFHQLANGIIINIPPAEGPVPVGCHVITYPIFLPPIPAGIYTLQMTRTYQVNPLRVIQIRSTSGQFAITRR